MLDRSIQHSLLAIVFGLVWSGCSPRNGSQDDSVGGLDYPNQTVTLICPWSPGGGTDSLSRFMADQLQQKLGQPVVVVNKTGGGGAVGHTAGAMAAPDGYTLTMATFELSTMHWMGISNLSYQDFDPIMQFNADAAAILVGKDAPWQDIGAFLDHVKANPGEIQMSGTASGGAWDLARAGLQIASGLPVHAIKWVPTKGSAPSINELLGGHIDAVCCSLPEANSQLKSGELRALAVMSEGRLEEFPDVPTMRESGVEWEAVGWRGLAVPKGTPLAVKETLQAALVEITQSNEFKTFMDKFGFNITIRNAEDFTEFLKEQDSQWEKVIREAGFSQNQ